MQTPNISTRSLFDTARYAVRNLTADFARAQRETVSGRLSDAGETLGARALESFSFRQEMARLGAIRDANTVASTRLDASQGIIGNLIETAENFVSTLLAARDASGNQAFLPDQARANISAMTAALNASNGGSYLFGGINSEAKPLADHNASGSASGTMLDAAFLSAFGVTATSPGAAAITPSQIQTFIDGSFAALFNAANWSAAWSSASNTNAASLISPSETIGTSANANETSFRVLMSAYVMVADLGGPNLNREAFHATLDAAVSVTGAAIQGLTALQARLGVTQEQIAAANNRMERQSIILGGQIGTLESVDPFEAASRVTELQTQLETAYALTARLERLSILNYL